MRFARPMKRLVVAITFASACGRATPPAAPAADHAVDTRVIDTPTAAPDGPPQLEIGQPRVAGGLDAETVRGALVLAAARLERCYEQELAARPRLAGAVEVTFGITRTGAVGAAAAMGFDTAVAGCVVEIIRAMRFKKPRRGKVVDVTCVFAFRRGP